MYTNIKARLPLNKTLFHREYYHLNVTLKLTKYFKLMSQQILKHGLLNFKRTKIRHIVCKYMLTLHLHSQSISLPYIFKFQHETPIN